MKSIIQAFCLLLASHAACATETVEVSVPTIVYDRSDPAFCISCGNYKLIEVTDGPRLTSLDGVGPADAFADYLADGLEGEQALAEVVSGGYLRLSYAPGQERLVARVTYNATRPLTQAELAVLAEYTRGQLTDGIGEGFTQSGTYKQRVWVEFDVVNRENVTVLQQSP